MKKEQDEFTRQWIIDNSVEIISRYDPGELTIRGLHYQLVAIGMTNTITHYKRVVAAMISARWDDVVEFEAFSDHDRAMIGETKSEVTDLETSIEDGKEAIKSWMTLYFKNRWENQPNYVEVFIEKKALQGVFQKSCTRAGVALGACKGYPSLTFLKESSLRFVSAVERGKNPIILYFGDYDPSGEDIPRSIKENLIRMGCPEIEVRRILLMKNQVIKYKLPPAPVKEGDSRSAKWDGLGQVELDALAPEIIQNICLESVYQVFDDELFDELKEIEETESVSYRSALKEYVINMEFND